MDEAGFTHPLVWAGWRKTDVRVYARRIGLPNAEQPSDACLASRVRHGQRLSAELLGRVEAAEAGSTRAASDGSGSGSKGPAARVEVDPVEVERLLAEPTSSEVRAGARARSASTRSSSTRRVPIAAVRMSEAFRASTSTAPSAADLPAASTWRPTSSPKGTSRSDRRARRGGSRVGERFVTLLGVTGSGKTFTMAHVVAAAAAADARDLAEQDARRPARERVPGALPANAVEYFVSYYDYYQPEAYVPQIDLYVEKDASINEEIDRLRHRATQALLTRRDTLIVASVSCIYGLGSPEDYRASVVELVRGEDGRPPGAPRPARPDEVRPQRHGAQARALPSPRRHRRRHGCGRDRPSDRPRRQHRIESIIGARPGHRRRAARARPARDLPGDPLPDVDERTSRDPQARSTRRRRPASGELLREEKIVEAQRLKSRTEYDIEMIRETGYCSGIENYARYFAGSTSRASRRTRSSTSSRRISSSSSTSPTSPFPQIGGMFKGDRSAARTHSSSSAGASPPAGTTARSRSPSSSPASPQVVFVSATPGPFERKRSEDSSSRSSARPGSSTRRSRSARRKGRSPTSPRAQGRDRTGRSRARHHPHEGDLRGPRPLPRRPGPQGPLPPLGGRDAQARRDPPGPAARAVRRPRRDQPAPRGPRPPRSEPRRDPRRRQGRLPAERDLPHPDQSDGPPGTSSGRCILYADRRTGSMDRAIAEMNRRRAAQVEYNAAHGIVPSTIRKEVRALLAEEEVAAVRGPLDFGSRQEVEGAAPAPPRQPRGGDAARLPSAWSSRRRLGSGTGSAPSRSRRGWRPDAAPPAGRARAGPSGVETGCPF